MIAVFDLFLQAADQLGAKDYAQGGVAVLLMGLLFFVVNTLRSVNKENADRAVTQQNDCAEQNQKTLAVVTAITDRFAETALKMQDGIRTMQQEQRAANDRREERLHETLRQIQLPPRGPDR